MVPPTQNRDVFHQSEIKTPINLSFSAGSGNNYQFCNVAPDTILQILQLVGQGNGNVIDGEQGQNPDLNMVNNIPVVNPRRVSNEHPVANQQSRRNLPPSSKRPGAPSKQNLNSNCSVSSSATRSSQRLFVGNIPSGCSEIELLNFFNSQMNFWRLYQSEENPASSCKINHEGDFAFLEFRSIEETTNAIALDGIKFRGKSLKVRRPNDFKLLPGMTEFPQVTVPGVISSFVKDSPNKLFIGGLPNFLNEDQIINYLLPFGQLKSFKLVKDALTGYSKGFAFFEYVDMDSCDKVMMQLNGQMLNGKQLVVQRAKKGEQAQFVQRSSSLYDKALDVETSIIETNENHYEAPSKKQKVSSESPALCLYCPYSDASSIWDHMRDQHNFNFKDTVRSCALSSEQQIKFLNFLRQQSLNSQCIACDTKFEDQEQLSKHLDVSNHGFFTPNLESFDQIKYLENPLHVDGLLKLFFKNLPRA